MTDLTGRVALVTGGNGGIGLAMAQALAVAGADVAIWGTREEKNRAALEELAGTGRRVHAEQCDVSSEDDVRRAFAATVESLGHVDITIANAGTFGAVPSVHEISLEEWRRVLAVNLDGAFLTFREAARHLVERGEGGSLVAVASTAAVHGAAQMPHYAASKSGVLGLVRSYAVGLARHKVRVNALLPGWTETEMTAPARGSEAFVQATTARTPVRRWAAPDEFGDVATYLADPALTFHTGDTVTVDGGYTVF